MNNMFKNSLTIRSILQCYLVVIWFHLPPLAKSFLVYYAERGLFGSDFTRLREIQLKYDPEGVTNPTGGWKFACS